MIRKPLIGRYGIYQWALHALIANTQVIVILMGVALMVTKPHSRRKGINLTGMIAKVSEETIRNILDEVRKRRRKCANYQ